MGRAWLRMKGSGRAPRQPRQHRRESLTVTGTSGHVPSTQRQHKGSRDWGANVGPKALRDPGLGRETFKPEPSPRAILEARRGTPSRAQSRVLESCILDPALLQSHCAT